MISQGQAYEKANRIRIREDVPGWARTNADDVCSYLKPHVMPLVEAKAALKADDETWMELSEAKAKATYHEPLVVMIRMKNLGYWFSQYEDIIELDNLNDPYIALRYNRDFRFWSGKPSKERMREVKWDD